MQSRYFKIIPLLLVFGLAPALKANELLGQDVKIFNQANIAMSQHSWEQAERLLSQLHKQWPEDRVISNNLAVSFFNLGRLDEAQELFSEIINSNEHTRLAFQNLQSLYGYSAAKAYSKGLNLLKPIELPSMVVSSYATTKIDARPDAKIAIKQNQKNQSAMTQFEENTLDNSIKVSEVLPAQTISQQAEAKITPLEKLSGENNKQSKIDTSVSKMQAQDRDKQAVVTSNVVATANKVVPKESLPIESKPIESQASDKQILGTQLAGWAKAWSNGNVNAYIDFYSPNYAPRGKSRKSWLKNRQSRVNPNKKIEIKLSDQQIYIQKNNKQANTLFTQKYRSKNYQDKVKKRITWVKHKGAWLISKEVIIKTL